KALALIAVRGFAEQHGLRNLVHRSANRLAKRVVEITGRTGEHYIAGSREEWWSMGYGAIGAGALTAVTAVLKYDITGTPLPPLLIGVASAANYAGGFTRLQVLGWHLG